MWKFGFIILVLVHICSCKYKKKTNVLSREFIDGINSKNSTWRAGQNFPEDTPIKDIKKLLGVLPDAQNRNLPKRLERHGVVNDLPENFDSRLRWPECPSLREIRDQGVCGSCWAISAVEAMTDRVCINSKGKKHFHFSTDNLLACCNTCGNGCKGGFPAMAWKYWLEDGIVSGGNYGSHIGCQPDQLKPCKSKLVNVCPSEVDTPKCRKYCEKTYNISYENDKHYGMEVYSLGYDEYQIRSEIYQHGPVQASYTVYDDFINYKSGIYQHVDGNVAGGHAVKLIGWGVEEGTPYWLAANSWNSYWGENGYFRILRGSNHCGIESKIDAGMPLYTRV